MWWLMALARRTFHRAPKHPVVGGLLWAFCPMAAGLWRDGRPPDDEPRTPWVWGLVRRAQLGMVGGRLADRLAEWGLGGWVDYLRVAVDRAEAFRSRQPRWRAAERTPYFRAVLREAMGRMRPPVPPRYEALGWTGEDLEEALLALVFLWEDLRGDAAEMLGGPVVPGLRAWSIQGISVPLITVRRAEAGRPGAEMDVEKEREEEGEGVDGVGELALVPLEGDPLWLAVARGLLRRPAWGVTARGELVEPPAAGRGEPLRWVQSLVDAFSRQGPPGHPAGMLWGGCAGCGYRRECPAWASGGRSGRRERESPGS